MMSEWMKVKKPTKVLKETQPLYEPFWSNLSKTRSVRLKKTPQEGLVFGRTDAEAETPILWPPNAKSCLIGKDPWCWERLKAGGERDDRGWDGWMASLTQWTWVWASSGSWWWTGKVWRAAVYGVASSLTWPSDWETATKGIWMHVHYISLYSAQSHNEARKQRPGMPSTFIATKEPHNRMMDGCTLILSEGISSSRVDHSWISPFKSS